MKWMNSSGYWITVSLTYVTKEGYDEKGHGLTLYS